MESHEILREALKKHSPKEVAAALGVSMSLVYKWAQPPECEGAGSGVTNPLERTAAMMKLTRDPAIVRWLAHRAGGYFVKNPAHPSAPVELTPAMNDIIQQFADLLGAISTAAEDHRITTKETQLIRKHWDELKSITEGFVRACEGGDFDKLPQGRR